MASNGGRDDQPEPTTVALRHPVRREILRYLHACGCERSPATLTDQLGIGWSRVSYHVRVLATTGCLTRTEGIHQGRAIEFRYKSAVASSAPVLVILKATAKEDTELLRQERAEKAGI